VEVLFDGAVVARVGAVDGVVTLDASLLADDVKRAASLRRAINAALEPVGVVIEGGAADAPDEWSVAADGATAPFIDGMTVAPPAGGDVAGRAAAVKAGLDGGRVAKKALGLE
jgi:hypothetical protein